MAMNAPLLAAGCGEISGMDASPNPTGGHGCRAGEWGVGGGKLDPKLAAGGGEGCLALAWMPDGSCHIATSTFTDIHMSPKRFATRCSLKEKGSWHLFFSTFSS